MVPSFISVGDGALPTLTAPVLPEKVKASKQTHISGKSRKISKKESSSCVPGVAFVPSLDTSAMASVVPTLSAPSSTSLQTDSTLTASEQLESPAAEFRGKPRWQTPLRVGKWPEAWQSARELGTHLCVRSANASDISVVLRTVLADAVVTYVGPHLPTATVEKWLCLLCEYLELNVDEQILVICLLRKYAQAGGRFIGQGDWARPQRWECVIAIACYLAVLLSEEFPGRTAMDLRELLGPNFRFGVEQIAFLKTVNWRICVTADQIEDVKSECRHVLDGDSTARLRMREWFGSHARDIADAKLWAESKVDTSDLQLSPSPSVLENPLVEKSDVEKPIATNDTTVKVGKKRSLASVVQSDDSVVPRYVVPRIDPSAAAAAAAVAAAQAQARAHAHAQAHAHAHAHAQLQAHAHVQQLHAQMAAVGAVPTAFIPTIPTMSSLTGVPTVTGVPTMGSLPGVSQWPSRW